MSILDKIIKYDLCLGCGLCEAVDKYCHMELNTKGFYTPSPIPSDKDYIKILKKLCPGISVREESKANNEVWGNVEFVTNAWASDKEIRHKSSSGGVTSALALYLLESGKVDAILQVGCSDRGYLYNSLHVSRTRDDILSRNASRYAPALVFNHIFKILDDNPERKYCFIGKPCDIAAMRNIVREYPEYADRVTHYLAIFCAGIPSYNATKKAIETFGNKKEPASLRYRGDGWPGFFTVTYEDGTKDRMTYNDSWGKILGRQLGFRCKVCPDGIGLLADVSSGDSWNTKDGYPDFDEAEGRNFCFIRTPEGKKLFDDAQRAGYILSESVETSSIKDMQPYQYQRRHIVGWRIGLVQIMTGGIFNFKNLGYTRMAMKTNYLHAVRDAVGTLKRLTKVKRGGGENLNIYVSNPLREREQIYTVAC